MSVPTDPAEKLQFLLELARTMGHSADEEALERQLKMSDLDMATAFAEEYLLSYGMIERDECDKLIELLTPLAGHIRNLSWKTLYQEPIEDYDLKFLIEPFGQIRYRR